MPVFAPFTAEQVESLNAYQKSDTWHPFTCTGDHGNQEDRLLVASEDGWRCEVCGYTQTHAHKFMTDWSWKKGIEIRSEIKRSS